MKILIIDKVHSKKSELCIDSLINKAKTGEHLELTKINFFTERDEDIKYEYYLIILNDIKSFPEELLKFENESKVIIVTENINTTHILECIGITSNLLYIKSDTNTLLLKICKICNSIKKDALT